MGEVGQMEVKRLRDALSGMIVETDRFKHTFSKREMMACALVPIQYSYEPDVKLYHYRLKFEFSIKNSLPSEKKGEKGRRCQSIAHSNTEDIKFIIYSSYHFTCKIKQSEQLTWSKDQVTLPEGFDEKMSGMFTTPLLR